MNHRAEIDRLLALEREYRLDLAIRLVGVPFGSFLLYLYTDTLIPFLWSAGHLACYLLYRVCLGSHSRDVTDVQMRFLHVLVCLLSLSFIWLPALMLIDLDRNQALVGAGLIGAHLVHLVHRGDTSLFLIAGTTLTIFGVMVTMLVIVLPQITDVIAIIGVVISWFALMLYLGQSLLAARARILAENAARDQIFETQKLAALGTLAGGIAHDFNNLLTAISGNIELADVLTDEAEKSEVLQEARRASGRAATIVEQILIYARKSPVNMVDVDANAPLTGLDALCAKWISPQITLEITPMAGPPIVHIDRGQVVTGLINLVQNAADATRGAGRITLTVTREQPTTETAIVGENMLPPGDYVVYRVTDFGDGIADDILANVTDPFFSTKPTGQGTGLGLSMVVSIAATMGGGLAIDTSSSGSVMRIYVPVS